MTRHCACGCPRSMDGKRKDAKYATSQCRLDAWKARKKIVGVRYVKSVQNGSPRKQEQPRVRLDLALEAARDAHAGRDPLESVLLRLTDRQRESYESQQERRMAA